MELDWTFIVLTGCFFILWQIQIALVQINMTVKYQLAEIRMISSKFNMKPIESLLPEPED